jgi:uncharacterized protein (DUF1330 family)
MAAYLIVDLEVTDPEGFREYQKRAGSTLEPYGGKYLVRGGPMKSWKESGTPIGS